MARSQAIAVTNSFTKGLITEATGLNFPEDAVTDADNCVFERIGNVTRRLGIDLEPGFTANATDPTDAAITEFLWKGAASNGSVVFLALQIGDNISFYRLDGGPALSTSIEGFFVDLADFKTAGSPDVASRNVAFASGNGVLFVTHPYCEPFYVQYNAATNTITSTQINVRVRDMRGIDQSAEIPEHNTRPSSPSDSVQYNLLNQGWVSQTRYANVTGLEAFNLDQQVNNNSIGVTAIGVFTYDPIPALDAWFDIKPAPLTGSSSRPNPHTTVWPSEAETWWYYLYEGFSTFFDTSAGSEKFPLNAPAAKGHFLFPAFNINRAAVATAEYVANGGTRFTALDVPSETAGFQRPAQCAFFAGRAFYAGVDALNYNTKIYFTKVIEIGKDYGQCYQTLDPTSKDGGDLVASDGGIIVIPEMAQVVKMFVTGSNLFVFATNGIWRIAGGLGNTGFAANAYAISRVSTINAESALSFVDVDGMPIWWNSDGIWTLKADQMGTAIQVQPLSLSTIQTFLEPISATNKQFVKGAFNPFSRIVQWIYRDTEATTIQEQFQYYKILNYDLLTGAFYPFSLPTASQTNISGIFVPQGIVSRTGVTQVLTSTGSGVVTSTDEIVTVPTNTRVNSNSIFKYIVTVRSF